MLRKFLNNNFGFSGYETLRSQNTGKEIKLVNLIELLEKKGKALDIMDNIRKYCTDDEIKVKFYLMNVMENTLEC
ncbi:MAG: hypothetical protein AB6733_03150 [Clostridiaceae bacterium]